MSTQNTSKPIASTFWLVLLGLLLFPLPIVDVIGDILVVFFIWRNWSRYLTGIPEAEVPYVPPARTAQHPPKDAATQYCQLAIDAKKAGNDAEAFRLFRISAENNHPHAMNGLGVLYLNGHGAPKDYDIAADWFERAFNHGERQYALANLTLVGSLYDSGNGVTKDAAKAARYYRKAAELGEPEAQCHVGLSYLSGQGGVAKDISAAQRWLGLAAAKGHQPALQALVALGAAGSNQGSDRFAGELSRTECLAILGLTEPFTADDVKRAHREAMLRNHPDRGGSTYLMQLVNLARDSLLG